MLLQPSQWCQQFIQVVKEGRGERLVEDQKLFSGLVWSGERSVSLGLVDALCSSGYVAREVIGEEQIVDFTSRRDFLERLADFVGASIARGLSDRLGLEPLAVR